MWWYAHNKCALKYASLLFSSATKRGQALRFILSLSLALTKLTRVFEYTIKKKKKKDGASFSLLTAAHNFPCKLQEQQGLSLHQWRSRLYLTRLLQSPQPQVHENWIGFFFFGWKLYMIVLTIIIIIIILLLKIIFGGNGDEEEAEEERIWYGLLCCAYHCS